MLCQSTSNVKFFFLLLLMKVSLLTLIMAFEPE